jgi:hypothetical protein
MIRWEETALGEWQGFSGSLVVAKVGRDPAEGAGERWLWEMRAVKRLPNARASGHRTSEIEARRAADSYWARWLEAAALKPDLQRLADTALKAAAKAGKKPRKS